MEVERVVVREVRRALLRRALFDGISAVAGFLLLGVLFYFYSWWLQELSVQK